MAPSSRDGSSTSRRTTSPRSRRSARASRTSASPGSPRAQLTPRAVRELALRHGVRPRKSLGQHFLIEPALARRIVELAEVVPGTRVLEVGAGLGSLTVELARAGAEVVAVEVDSRLLPALAESTASYPGVRIEALDATEADWRALLDGPGPWRMVANLPYNVAVPVVMRALDTEPRIDRFVVMVQREVGERLAASPGEPQYGAVSVRVAYRADARVIRRVPPSVFWPRPTVDSVLVALVRRPPPVPVDESLLWPVIEVAFEQRRKTIRNALIRLGLDPGQAREALAACGTPPSARAEQLGLEEFACLATQWASWGRAATP